jgi:hypothetical protein
VTVDTSLHKHYNITPTSEVDLKMPFWKLDPFPAIDVGGVKTQPFSKLIGMRLEVD